MPSNCNQTYSGSPWGDVLAQLSIALTATVEAFVAVSEKRICNGKRTSLLHRHSAGAGSKQWSHDSARTAADKLSKLQACLNCGKSFKLTYTSPASPASSLQGRLPSHRGRRASTGNPRLQSLTHKWQGNLRQSLAPQIFSTRRRCMDDVAEKLA